MIKGSVHLEYMKSCMGIHLRTELRNRQTTATLGDFNTPHYKINETTKNIKVREDFNNTIKHITLKFIEHYILLFSTVLEVQASTINDKRK